MPPLSKRVSIFRPGTVAAYIFGMSLREYRQKRRFNRTREPRGKTTGVQKKPIFVVQEHHARRLHWDFRLEAEGVLKSWAVTREPSVDESERRLAIETEDHPFEYARFKGTIPVGEYGAGLVKIWDRGTYAPAEHHEDVVEGMDRGIVVVVLRGRKLKGRFVLVRTRGEGTRSQWLFFKAKAKPSAMKVPDVDELRRRRSM